MSRNINKIKNKMNIKSMKIKRKLEINAKQSQNAKRNKIIDKLINKETDGFENVIKMQRSLIFYINSQYAGPLLIVFLILLLIFHETIYLDLYLVLIIIIIR